MNRRKVFVIAGVLSIVLVGGGVFFLATMIGGGSNTLNRQLAVTREWARLAPFPESANHIHATTEGSSFTRAFRVSFTAPAGDIERWLKSSPGTREAKPESTASGKRHFAIIPGGGAQHAEVNVDDETGEVRIYVYWS